MINKAYSFLRHLHYSSTSLSSSDFLYTIPSTYWILSTLSVAFLSKFSMVNHLLFVLLLPASLHLSSAFRAGEPTPIQLVTSDKYYGPDGPWQAVTVWLGTQRTPVDLYPGGTYGSPILSNTVCDGVKAYPCGSGGLYNPSGSRLFYNNTAQIPEDPGWVLGALKYRIHPLYCMDQLYISARGDEHVQNLSILLVDTVSMIYPDGTNYPIQLGTLSLGGASPNQTFSSGEVFINAPLLPGSLWEQDLIPSSSFGMHLGSATLGPPLSLWLGGYDQSRIVGPVSVQVLKDVDPSIDLLDIGIGVEHGASPFAFRSRGKILAEGNSSISRSIPLIMNPNAPYLAVPNSTCAAIAKNLPVTYNPKYGLYFWNVTDPLYNRIVRSPSYLSFTFRAAGLDTANITIKVPFQLLNLTLDAPLVTTPIQYFPCQPPQDSDKWSLGRAFLQAAFIGIDWNYEWGKWYLAQAPGPNTASNPNQSPLSYASVVTSSAGISWSDTWEGYWFPLADDLSQLNPTSSIQPAGSGLKAWKIAVIVIGSIVGLSLLGFLIYYYCYQRGPKSETPHLTKEVLSSIPGEVLTNMPNFTMSELPDRQTLEQPNTDLTELPNGRERAELGNHALGIAP